MTETTQYNYLMIFRLKAKSNTLGNSSPVLLYGDQLKPPLLPPTAHKGR